ncbi:hypothetical protein AB1K89_04070 [Sporosarcina sp. 179-K 8C2 HS]|uniref:hypothetical protein n=1 Tax=Sporosarcina sp. 179-K 8C2 HS TaxID=3142387 RepID=UPI0039A19FEE
MFWKYLLFETKLLMHNRKNWLLGIALILFFPLYYLHYSQTDLEDLLKKKNLDSQQFHTIFNAFPTELRHTPEGEGIYNNLTQQIMMIDMQRFYLWQKKHYDKFIENGLKLNELRLELHELGNKGIHPNHIIPKDEIQRESALLRYYQENDLPLIPNPLAASNYLPVTLRLLSGLLFCLLVLVAGSSMLVKDQVHRSVVSGFPVSFMQKVCSKVAIHFVQIMLFLFTGISAGVYYVAKKSEIGNFTAPVLIYQDGDFFAVSTTRYIIYMLIAFALITLLLLLAFALINVVTKNLYASAFILLVILLLPDLMRVAEVQVNWLYPLKFIDIGYVLNGDAALEFGNKKLDFKNSYIWLISMNVIVASALYFGNKLVHMRKVEGLLKTS